jgi:hypothetical protein
LAGAHGGEGFFGGEAEGGQQGQSPQGH